MKAIVQEKYGPPEVLHLKEIPEPVPADNQVLVRIKAASMNAADWHLMRGSPFIMRLFIGGLFKPKKVILGADIAGTVEAVGSKVSLFKPGDEVFGDISGSGFRGFAEYATVKEDELVLKPVNLNFEEAAAIPLASVTALRALRNTGKIKPGQDVLINGASGGVGTFAVQIAKILGAHVTAVCSTAKVEQARLLGADLVIDYKTDDITKGGKLYDLIMDAAAYRPVSDYKKILRPKGTYVLVGGSGSRAIRVMMLGSILSMTTSKTITSMVSRPDRQDLTFMKGLIEQGKIKPVIDRKYRLHELPEAMKYLEEGHARGKIVIKIG